MNKSRRIVRQNRLQTYVRILSDKYNTKLEVHDMSSYGFCYSTTHIFIKDELDKDKIVNLILQKSVTLHEMGHLLYTSSSAWKGVDNEIRNIISDGRVEQAVSRVYPRAKLYFVYGNQKLLPVVDLPYLSKENLESLEIERILLQIVFREAKRNTGIPQLPDITNKKIIDKFGKNVYDFLIKRTRAAVDTKTEKQAANISKEIEDTIKKIMNKSEYSRIVKIESSSSKVSLEKCGSSARQMPKPTDDKESKEFDNKLGEMLKRMAEEIEKKLSESKDDSKNDSDKDDKRKTSIKINEDLENQIIVDNALQKDKEDDDGFMDKIKSEIDDEIKQDLSIENDILRSKEMEPNFGSYGLTEDDEMEIRTKYGSKRLPVDVNDLEPMANRMAHMFRMVAERGDGWKHNQTRGRLEITKVTRIIDNNPRVFRKRDRIDATDLSATILLDASGSMKWRSEDATKAAYIISRALELGGYKSEVVQFGTYGGYYSKELHGVKSFNQKVKYARGKFVPAAVGLTPMYKAMGGARKSLELQNSKRKVLFIVTDGSPTDDKKVVTNPSGEEKTVYGLKCKAIVNDLEKRGTIVVPIFIGSGRDKHKIFNPDHSVKCRNVSKLPKHMSGVIKKVLMSIKR